MKSTFEDDEKSTDTRERAFCFLEEAIELVQAVGFGPEEVGSVTQMVMTKPIGDIAQEVGGTMATLLALCDHLGVDTEDATATELTRIEDPDVQKRIKAKQELKRAILI